MTSENKNERLLRYPSLRDFRWRLDICISTQSQSRVMRPTILVEMTTTEGIVRQFSLSIEKFHELRYNVAKVLKDMDALEKQTVPKNPTLSSSTVSASSSFNN
jgi:hypothetical protein